MPCIYEVAILNALAMQQTLRALNMEQPGTPDVVIPMHEEIFVLMDRDVSVVEVTMKPERYEDKGRRKKGGRTAWRLK